MKTSHGLARRIDIPNIIMQGGVFGSIMCTKSIDKLAKEVYCRKELLYMYKGVAAVPPLLMVDDILTISKCSITATALNATVNAFIESKKLKLSHDKCSVIHVGKKSQNCPDLKVHKKSMHREEKTKYLGDIIHSSGKSKPNILERAARAYAILSEIRAILADVPLGKYKTEIGLQLRQSMFVNGVMFNSETWQGLGSTDITMLEVVDHKLMDVICNGHSKTPTEFYYLETGTLPIKNVLASRRIMFLHTILGRDKDEITRRVLEAQINNPTKADFIDLVKEDLRDIDEEFNIDNISQNTKTEFKAKIQKKIRATTLKQLTSTQMTHSKIRDIKYKELKIQPYLESGIFTNTMVKTLFNMRSSMTRNIKNNFSSMHRGNLGCKLCQEPDMIDSQPHLLCCVKLREHLNSGELEAVNSVTYNDIFGSLVKQREVSLILTRIMELREDLLEKWSLPVGDTLDLSL